jgi:hypothetical protein
MNGTPESVGPLFVIGRRAKSFIISRYIYWHWPEQLALGYPYVFCVFSHKD